MSPFPLGRSERSSEEDRDLCLVWGERFCNVLGIASKLAENDRISPLLYPCDRFVTVAHDQGRDGRHMVLLIGQAVRIDVERMGRCGVAGGT
jgi:hypothetical protein